MMFAGWYPIASAQDESPATSLRGIEVGRFSQAVAVHAECQAGLPSPDVRSIHLADGRQLIAETAAGAVRWQTDRWLPTSDVPRHASTDLPHGVAAWQTADGPHGRQAVASDAGLFERSEKADWQPLTPRDGLGRVWAAHDVRGVAYDAAGRLWFASLAGVGRRDEREWRFFEGKDGLPYNDFTCCTSGGDGSIWFGTHRGAIRFHEGQWSYRQGRRWLPDDDVRAIAIVGDTVWLATAAGVGCIEHRPMTLAEKARHYEQEIDRYIKRTPYGYVAEVHLTQPGDKRHVRHHDSDNDGLWTSMYGASQCFAYAVDRAPEAQNRAKQAFEALRFLQIVTQGGSHSPPRGFVARTILPADSPDPNQSRLEADRREQADGDRLWKVYEPRWPKSADGKWYWKSDTSSDELDGHYFFYPLYYDLVAQTDTEKARVRQVVRDLTDHLVNHGYALVDHDGHPTRWGNYRPESLNHDANWWPERGLNSLSLLSYLAVARHMTGDERYQQIAERLMETHAYGMNALVPKVQRGIGSGNQSDDEMAFMSFYNLIKYTQDPALRAQFTAAFYAYWMLEQPERNPFFHFCYAASASNQTFRDPFETYSLAPWGDWLEDSIDALKRFPIDRLDWAHTNSHRLDLVRLPVQQGPGALDLNDGRRGYRVDGKVLPVDERFFAHWNTDPWRLDDGGQGRTLASGTVFLLPYQMGRYHGLIREVDIAP
jgi:hypothetical protein